MVVVKGIGYGYGFAFGKAVSQRGAKPAMNVIEI